jgi:hypothetical protein
MRSRCARHVPPLAALLALMCAALALVIGANSSLSVALPDLAATSARRRRSCRTS